MGIIDDFFLSFFLKFLPLSSSAILTYLGVFSHASLASAYSAFLLAFPFLIYDISWSLVLCPLLSIL